MLKRIEKFSGTKRSREDIDDQVSNPEENEEEKPEESSESHKRVKSAETEEVKVRNIDLKLKQISERKNLAQKREVNKRAPFNFVSVLHKAKSNLATEK